MDSNVVVLLIGLAIFVWSIIFRRRRKGRGAGKTASKPGLMSIITEKIRQSVAELDKRAATEPETGRRVREVPDPWAQLGADESTAQVQSEDVRSQDEAFPEWETDVVEARAETLRPGKTPVAPPASPAPVPPVPVVSPPVTKRRTSEAPGFPGLSPHGLRSAVVWSEILAPPLALRKDDF